MPHFAMVVHLVNDNVTLSHHTELQDTSDANQMAFR